MSKRVTSSFTFPPDLIKAIDNLADSQNLSRSQLLEKWCREKIDEDKRNMAVLGNPVLMKALLGAFENPEVLKAMAAAVNDKLSDDQLELFHRGLQNVHQEASKVLAPRKRKGKK